MSYARWSDTSDVYVMLNCSGYLECVGCQVWAPTRAELWAHLDWHRAEGHQVPARAYDQEPEIDAEMLAIRWRETPT